MDIKEAKRVIPGGGGEEGGWQCSLLGGFVSSWLHQEDWSVSGASETTATLVVGGADVLAVNKMSTCGMWLDT